MKRVVLVIPDAGPLISLGRAHCLDLLLQLHLPRVHLLSTKAFLIGMEKLGYLQSAEAVWTAILASGRHPSDEIVDQPISAMYGRSYWLS